MEGARDVVLAERGDEREVDASRLEQLGERVHPGLAVDEEFHGQAHKELGFAAGRNGSFQHGDGKIDLPPGEPLVDLAAQTLAHDASEMGKLRAERFEQAGEMGPEHDTGSADAEDFEIGDVEPGDQGSKLLQERPDKIEEVLAGGREVKGIAADESEADVGLELLELGADGRVGQPVGQVTARRGDAPVLGHVIKSLERVEIEPE
jgi:hypothetical protein